MNIIDCQVHVWLPDTPDRPLVRGTASPPHLADALRYEQLLGLMNEAGVAKAVLIPPSWEGDRIDYPLEAAHRHPERFSVVGRVALDEPSSRHLIDSWDDEPALAGLRIILQRDHERAWLRDGRADAFWREAEKRRIPVMVHAAGVLDAIGEVARRHPGLTLLIDHLGTAGMKVSDPRFMAAIERTASLAAHPNVLLKLSSLPAYSVEAYPYRDVDRYVRQLVDAYGAERCCWGTDLTKLLPRATYRMCIDHVLQLGFLGEDDRTAILGGNLARVMRLRP